MGKTKQTNSLRFKRRNIFTKYVCTNQISQFVQINSVAISLCKNIIHFWLISEQFLMIVCEKQIVVLWTEILTELW